MKHFASPRFWKHYANLSPAIQKLADKNFDLLKSDPRHPSLHFKKAGKFWTVRVGITYRAIAKERDEGMVWFWIGHHSEYDQILVRG